jgi:F-type H+-transporting ATPase subunit delta
MDSLDWITVARPYAKAVFEAAIDEEGKALAEWSVILEELSFVASQPNVTFFIKRPDILPDESAAVFSSILNLDNKNKKNEVVERFLQLLAKAGRLGALPAIHYLYEQLRADYEKTIEASVIVFEPLTKEQEKALTASLKKRLNRDVHLTTQVDKSLLGGAIVKAGDLVMDGSVRGRMHRLSDEMMQ